MYNDSTNPYEYPDYTGGTTTQTTTQFGDPDGNGYWALIGGMWRWITEPLARSATTTP